MNEDLLIKNFNEALGKTGEHPVYNGKGITTGLDFLLKEYDDELVQSISIPWEGWHIISCLRRGEDKSVFLLADEENNHYILKIASGLKGDALEREYQTLSSLNNPYFPKALKFERHENRVYFLREYKDGVTLETYADVRSLPINEILGLGVEVCDILIVLHSQTPPVIHRDIKPQNFIITPGRRLMLVDFDSVQEHKPSKSQDTVFIGTVETAAPEQFGAARSSFATDVYGTGKLLMYLALNDTDTELLSKASIPHRLKRIIKRATAFDPKNRYSSIYIMKKALIKSRHMPYRITAVCCLLALLCLTAVFTLSSHIRRQNDVAQIDKNQTATFIEPLIEKVVAYQLNKEPGTITLGDLESLTTLLLCGDTPYDTHREVECYGKGDVINPRNVNVVNDGNISSLEDLRMMPNLRQLALYRQQIKDLSPLEGLPLTRLSLGENPIYNFSVLETLSELRYLDVGATNFSNASLLKNCRKLEMLLIFDTGVIDLTPVLNLPINTLYLHYDNVSDDITILQRFPGLTCLKIRSEPESALEVIGGIKTLDFLDISGGSAKTFESLVGLTKLKRLFVDDSPSLTSIEGAQAFTFLEQLSIKQTVVTDLSPLFNLNHLNDLNIANVRLSDETQLLQLTSLKRLRCAVYRVEHFQELLPDVEVFASR